MRKNHNTNFTLADILKSDILERITNNFSELEVGNWPRRQAVKKPIFLLQNIFSSAYSSLLSNDNFKSILMVSKNNLG